MTSLPDFKFAASTMPTPPKQMNKNQTPEGHFKLSETKHYTGFTLDEVQYSWIEPQKF